MVNGVLAKTSKDLHLDLLPTAAKRALLELTKAAWLGKEGWYLAGGTALALQAGHRESQDLDFFTRKANFDTEKLQTQLKSFGKWITTSRAAGTLYGKLFNAKISFIAYPFFHPSPKKISLGRVKLLSADDIAAMKIVAISQRGRKRDFFDLYWYCNNAGSLRETLERMLKQYPQQHNLPHIFRSLVYFDEAEPDADPRIYFLADWSRVKSYFRRETAQVSRQFLQLG